MARRAKTWNAGARPHAGAGCPPAAVAGIACESPRMWRLLVANGAGFNSAEAVRRRKNRGKTALRRDPGFQVRPLFKH